MEKAAGNIITEIAMSAIANDLDAYREDLRRISDSVAADGQHDRIREALAEDIKNHDARTSGAECSAVDASHIVVPLGTIETHASMAAEVYSNGTDAKVKLNRVTVPNRGQSMGTLPVAVRLPLEVEMLATSGSSLVFADGSWWSRLMETNKIITESQATAHAEMQRAVDSLTGENGLLAAVLNENIFSISKMGVSSSLSRRPGLREVLCGVEVSDKAVLASVLCAGEYTAPRLLKNATDGEFGVEKRGFSENQRKSIRDAYQGSILVTYYKPHGWSTPMRIEFPCSRRDSLPQVLDVLYTQTTPVGFQQPWVQVLADRVSKQIRGAGGLYESISGFEFPGIYLNTRT